ncbi:MAG TPA: dihydrodipicolinate synthase family protein [bacterium]|nr:dihydrodipicolinate synthase family protein [bacterium]
MHENLRGIIPPMTTPFRADETIDEAAFRADVRHLVQQAGVHGLAIAGSTGEGHTLSTDETVTLAGCAVEETAGKVPVICGIIADSTRTAVERGKAVAGLGVAALQVTPVHYLFRPDDDAMLRHFDRLVQETGMPVIIYNVVPWTYLSPALLGRIFASVEGVIGVKQSAGDLKLLADLLLTEAGHARIFTAVDALMYSSFALGAHGAIAAILTAAPELCVQLWDAVQQGDHAQGLDLHKRLLRVWNAINGDNLPATVRHCMELQGRRAGKPRDPMPPASEAQASAIRAALQAAGVPLA